MAEDAALSFRSLPQRTPSWTEQDQGKGSYVSIFDYSHGAVGDDFSLDSVKKFSFGNDHLLTDFLEIG